MSLYEILGLSSECSKEEIKKAFRELSKTHHPDKGGKEEDFKKIAKAYEVLSDPKKREAYDNGGDYESIESVQDKARNLLFGFIDAGINSFGFVPDHSDLIGEIEGKINESYRKNQNQLEQAKKDIRFYEDTKKRVKKGDMILTFLDNQISGLNHRISSMEEHKEVLQLCLKLAGEWEYEYEEDTEPIGGSPEELRQWAREYGSN